MTPSSDPGACATGPGWRLYRGDCLPILRRFPDACLDGVIADPPYCSGGWSAAQRRRPVATKYNHSIAQPGFAGDQRDQRGFVAWCQLWLAECYRALKPDRVCLVFIDWRNLPSLTDAVQSAGFVWRGVAVWDKGLASRPQPNWMRNQHEMIVAATKGGLPDVVPTVCLPGVIACPTPRERTHLTEKPLPLLRELVRLVPAGGVVCDPFAGAGTTGVAAIEAGLRFVGCEWSDEYHALAAQRLAACRRGRAAAIAPLSVAPPVSAASASVDDHDPPTPLPDDAVSNSATT